MTDWPYSTEWYAAHAHEPILSASQRIGRVLYRQFQPGRVLDVGCAVGGVLSGIRERALHDDARVDLVGWEHPAAVRVITAAKLWVPGGFVPLWPVDLASDTFRDSLENPAQLERYDLAVCTEVGEHLPAEVGERLVRFLTSVSGTIAWSAAIPGQGGEHHVNEQPREWWEEQFVNRRFNWDQGASRAFHAAAGPFPGAEWYGRLRIYRRTP